MKKGLIIILLSVLGLSAFAQGGKVRSGIIGGGSLGWFDDKPTAEEHFAIPDIKPSFHVGYQIQFELKHRFSVDAALLYGQKRGKLKSSGGYELGNLPGYKNLFKRNYISLNGVVNYNLIGGLKIGAGVEPTLHFKDRIMMENEVKSAFDIPIVAKVGYSFKYFDLAVTYKHGICNVTKGIPYIKSGKTRDLQVSLFIPIFR